MAEQDTTVLMNLVKESQADVGELDVNKEATIALINYFSELSKDKSHNSIDYEFLEQILHSAGKT